MDDPCSVDVPGQDGVAPDELDQGGVALEAESQVEEGVVEVSRLEGCLGPWGTQSRQGPSMYSRSAVFELLGLLLEMPV